jgi:hypothetical protein
LIQLTKNYVFLNAKKIAKLLEPYWLDPRSGIRKKRTQDPDIGIKKGPDPGSATLCLIGLVGTGTCELGAGNELETLHLSEVCGVAEHVYVEELRHIAAAPQRVLLPYRVPDIRTFLTKRRQSHGIELKRGGKIRGENQEQKKVRYPYLFS